jgi:hypothetical protein
MSHQRSNSDPSIISTAELARTALVSLFVLSAYFQQALERMLSNNEVHIDQILPLANQEIDWLQSRTDRFCDTIDVARVLRAMYDVSFSLGENSQRYTASAIAACYFDTDEQRENLLMELGEAWISHFLWPCKSQAIRLSLDLIMS